MARATRKKDVATNAAPARGPGMLAFIVAMVIGLGAGGAHGWVFYGAPAAPGEAAKHDAANKLQIKELPPIVANLAAPAESWVRLEASFAYEKDLSSQAEPIARQIADDALAFLKTIKLADFDTPAGYAELRRELDERAAIRTGGKIKRLYVQTIVVQ